MTSNRNRTYKFGYTSDNPSYEYIRYKIFNEPGKGSIKETFYTLNLQNAKQYFEGQLKNLYEKDNIDGLRDVYRKLTKRFLFNEYIIKDEFDVFVAFETMNNRGKKLSDLELLKNRLIYLTTLYTDEELDSADRHDLRESINSAWKEIYYQLGRNNNKPLNDDDFLKAHWIMYFTYSKKQSKDYIKFLLDNEFSPKKIHKKVEKEVVLEEPEEQKTDFEIDDTENENEEPEETPVVRTALLKPIEIKKYVNSLKESVVHWFNLHYPHLASPRLTQGEQNAIDRLNRIGMGYFHPLVMSFFKNESSSDARINFLDEIERFLFIVFQLCRNHRSYGDIKFRRAAHEVDKGKLKLDGIKEKLEESAKFCFHGDGSFNSKDFYDYLYKKFNTERTGYYGWNGLKYFLYEYELDLLKQSRQKKVNWDDLETNSKDKISIEHIFPQTPKNHWKAEFSNVPEDKHFYYSGSIGNLLLLSMSVNSSLQNNAFDKKKQPENHPSTGEKIRNGYSDGSHSEIEVSRSQKWDSKEIEERGLRLLTFMEKHWNIKFKDQQDKKSLLFLTGDDIQY